MKFYFSAVWSHRLMPVAKFENYMQAGVEAALRYNQIASSKELAEYNTLKTLIESEAYKKNQKGAIALAKISGNEMVKKYLAAQTEEEKQKWEGRKEVMTYTELMGSVVDYTKETSRYEELAKNADIQFYIAQDEQEMKKFSHLEHMLTDELNGNALNNGWKPGYLFANPALKSVISYPNELQAYTAGKNIETIDGILCMSVRKEKANASVWDAKKGMIGREMEYTSDMLHTDKFAIEPGMLVQVKAWAVGNALHAINLHNADHTQIATVLHKEGKQMKCGIHGKLEQIDRIIGLPYAVYSFYWGANELIWYINDMEVCRMPNTLKNEKMFIHLYQSVTPEHKGVSSMKVDWVKLYKVKA